MVDVRPSSHQRNPPPFPVRDYVREVDLHLDAQRFAAVVEGENGELKYRNDQGRRKRTGQGVREVRWVHASVKTVDYELTVPCDMPYARTREELRWINSFHARLDGILSMQTIFSEVGNLDLPMVVTDFDRLHFYRVGWLGGGAILRATNETSAVDGIGIRRVVWHGAVCGSGASVDYAVPSGTGVVDERCRVPGAGVYPMATPWLYIYYGI